MKRVPAHLKKTISAVGERKRIDPGGLLQSFFEQPDDFRRVGAFLKTVHGEKDPHYFAPGRSLKRLEDENTRMFVFGVETDPTFLKSFPIILTPEF